MKRRTFLESVGVAGVGSAALGAASPLSAGWLTSSDEALSAGPEPSPYRVAHCKRILLQNLLRAGETLIISTPMIYDHGYFLAMLVAAGEIGATGLHMVVISHPFDPTAPENRMGPPPGYALTALHWDLYDSADLLITSNIGSVSGLPNVATSYNVKVGNHPYRSDHEYINWPGGRVRGLNMGGTDWSTTPTSSTTSSVTGVAYQERYFPTEDNRERAIRGAKLLTDNNANGELRVTNAAGSDWRCSMVGRPGHAQYGIANRPGRWDNFGYGCVACGPVEDSAEGVLVLRPKDMIMNIADPFLDEEVKLTFERGYVTKIEGGKPALDWEQYLASFSNREAYGIAHFGWGIHRKSRPSEMYHWHHNSMGSLLFSLGANFAHGLGGPEVDYSGLGMTTRRAPNHSHFAMFNCDVYVAGQKIIDRGRVAPEAGGIAQR